MKTTQTCCYIVIMIIEKLILIYQFKVVELVNFMKGVIVFIRWEYSSLPGHSFSAL